MKRYIARFKVYNGEATYRQVVATEAKNKKDAENYFKTYECETMVDIWVLLAFEEVKTFDELWKWL